MKVTKKTAGTIAIASLMGIIGGYGSMAYNGIKAADTLIQNPAQIRLNIIAEEASELEDQILIDCSYDRRNDTLPSEEQVDNCYNKINSYFALLMERRELKESPEFTSMISDIKSFKKYQAIGLGLGAFSFIVTYFSFSAYMSRIREEEKKESLK